MMLGHLCEVQGCLPTFVDLVVFAPPVDQELAHFELSFPRCIEQAGLHIEVQVVDIDPMPEQQLRRLEPTVTGSPVESILVVFVGIVEIEFVASQQSCRGCSGRRE